MVVALIALVVAMGGTGYAASHLPRNSVGASQIKRNAVRSSEVKNRSLLRGDFKNGQLPTRYFASIEAETGHKRSGTATSVGHPGTGRYKVRFAKDVSLCSAIVTSGWNAAGQNHGGVARAARGRAAHHR